MSYSSTPQPPCTPPPSIAMVSMVDSTLPEMLARKEKLESRLAMQKDLVTRTEQELQALLLLIQKRSTQKDEALRRLHSHRPCSPEQRPRPQ